MAALNVLRGSSIAKIIGSNVKNSNRFDPEVNMWVYEEMIDGRKLTEIINAEHENVKYLKGHKLSRNVVSLLVSTNQLADVGSELRRTSPGSGPGLDMELCLIQNNKSALLLSLSSAWMR